ncbi:serine-type peptidase [Aureococcus anophagefferens]|nr:serine-type peptidase [Aureococcus anophagefferens]
MKVSSPGSANYRKYWTHAMVGELLDNAAHVAAVKSWLSDVGALVVRTTKNGEYITAVAPLGVWTTALGCDFAIYTDGASETHRCAGAYSLPEREIGDVRLREDQGASADSSSSEYFTPSVLANFYGIPLDADAARKNYSSADAAPTGKAASSQAVFETASQNYSPDDLEEFRSYFGLAKPAATPLSDVGAHDLSSTCDIPVLGSSFCAEANLDIQYMTAANPYSPTTYFYVTEDSSYDPFLKYAMDIADMEHPILVSSISWGSIEPANPLKVMEAFNAEVAKIGLMGSTVFVSSGDDGANSYLGCAYMPSYPATSPYVTAVGATFAHDWDGEPGFPNEVVCQSDKFDGVITSGGGFSGAFASPSWNQGAVQAYFANLNAAEKPYEGFAEQGRGYPDLSLSGWGYEVVIGGLLYIVCGTSCSSPSVAGMVGRINADRLAEGKPPVGFLNPTLYRSRGAFAYDIVQGDNKCTDAGLCCDEGFYASKSWDPVTGWGSVSFEGLEAVLGEYDEDTVASENHAAAASSS